MSEIMYECVECGKKSTRSELKLTDGIYAHCPECRYNFTIEVPEKPKLVAKSKE